MLKNKNNYIFISMILFTIGVYMIGISTNIETCDYWWHIKTGEYIVNNGNVPTSDIFSWYGISNNLEWISHEWLSEVLLYLPYMLFGQSGGYIIASILFILTGIIIYIFNKDAFNKNLVFSIFWTMIGLIITISMFNPRPHMFSFILFLITLKIIFTFLEKEKSRLVWFIPLISILWVNLHGGSSNLPYILCLIAFFTGLIEKDFEFIKLRKLSKSKLRTLLIVSVVSIVALMFNPHGIKMIFYPYINMADSLMLNLIEEWRAPDLKLLGDYPIYILIFVIYIILLRRTKPIEFVDLAYILAFTFLTLKSIRFSPFLYAVSTFIIFKYINKKDWDEKIFSIGAIIFSILFIIININPAKDSYKDFSNMQLVDSSIIEDIKENDLKKIYNCYNVGGYLIYNDIKPFIDGRADMYSDNILKDYRIIDTMILNARELIEEYDFDSFLVEKGSAIDNYIEENPNYIKISSDKNYNLYKKIVAN